MFPSLLNTTARPVPRRQLRAAAVSALDLALDFATLGEFRLLGHDAADEPTAGPHRKTISAGPPALIVHDAALKHARRPPVWGDGERRRGARRSRVIGTDRRRNARPCPGTDSGNETSRPVGRLG